MKQNGRVMLLPTVVTNLDLAQIMNYNIKLNSVRRNLNKTYSKQNLQ